ncbi:MAG: hypothetical protein P1U88_09880 [Thalassobaculaceae bacterium]|nr:hypothetical protein [Thalassobaculaceae bacterium]
MAINLNDYERSEHSQNGEDGIIAKLVEVLGITGQTFLEIGASDGVQNNSMALIERGWRGAAVDMSPRNTEAFKTRLATAGKLDDVQVVCGRVTWANAPKLIAQMKWPRPTLLSLDIDSIDYYVAKRLLDDGMRPDIVVCEYNPFLGSDPITVDYAEEFARYAFQPEFGLYYGASLNAWKHLFGTAGYQFLCVDTTGVNAFFAAGHLPVEPLSGLAFAYTQTFTAKYRLTGEELSAALLNNASLRFVDVLTEDVDTIARAAMHKPS